jgi:hypothetical protein
MDARLLRPPQPNATDSDWRLTGLESGTFCLAPTGFLSLTSSCGFANCGRPSPLLASGGVAPLACQRIPPKRRNRQKGLLATQETPSYVFLVIENKDLSVTTSLHTVTSLKSHAIED